jgi:tRNA A37 threonylcarbamoyladenosine dehydratase
MTDRYTRSRVLFGENFQKLQKAKILLLGVGGVGGHCLDALYRSGVLDITIIDYDVYDVTNQNRQIGSEAEGISKVERLSQLYKGVKPISIKLTPEYIETFDFEPYDLILDAIDDLPCKVALAKKTYKKLISSMGSAKKLDPTKIQITNIWKTYNDGLAKKFRAELKKAKFDKKFDVIFSDELPNCEGLGSFVGVTGSFGLAMASLAIKKLLDTPTLH